MGKRFVLPAIVALLALNAVLLVAQPSFAVTHGVWSYFFGPKMVRAEVVVKDAGVVHLYRLDRGRIRTAANQTLTLIERDGAIVTIAVAPNARITLNGIAVPFSALRPRMQAATVRDGDRPAHLVRATWRR